MYQSTPTSVFARTFADVNGYKSSGWSTGPSDDLQPVSLRSTSGDVTVLYCVFRNCYNFANLGAAINVGSNCPNGIVRDSTFTQCSTTEYGGAMCFDAKNAEVTRCCGDHCVAVMGTFVQLGGSGIGTSRCVEECTVYRCSTMTSGINTAESAAISTNTALISIARINFTDCYSGTGAAAIGALERTDGYLNEPDAAIAADGLIVASCHGRFSAFFYAKKVPSNISNSLFVDNRHTNGVILTQGALALTGCAFSGNTVENGDHEIVFIQGCVADGSIGTKPDGSAGIACPNLFYVRIVDCSFDKGGDGYTATV
jgi:hypothetical protein